MRLVCARSSVRVWSLWGLVRDRSLYSSLFKLALFELEEVISFLSLEFGYACGCMCMYISVCGFEK